MKTKYILLIITLNISQLLFAQEFKWANKVTTNHHSFGQDIKLDGNKNVYAGGSVRGTVTFISGKDTFNFVSDTSSSYIISKLNRTGEVLWVRAVNSGITDQSAVIDIAVDNAGNVYVTGEFKSTCDFDPGAGVVNLTAVGSRDAFILKLDASGNFLWAKQIGGLNASCIPRSITLDGNNNIFISGSFINGTVDFNPGTSVNNLTPNGMLDAFVLKLTNSGDFAWVNQIGDVADDGCTDLQIDQSGDIYITGVFRGTINFNLTVGGSIGFSSKGSSDTYVCKLNTDGQYLWAKHFGATTTTMPYLSLTVSSGLALDHDKGVYITGYYRRITDFDPGVNTYYLSTVDLTADNVFITKLDANGNFVWAKSMGGLNFSGARAIAVDGNKNVYTTGSFIGEVDFDPGSDSVDLVANNSASSPFQDAFISMLDSLGNYMWAKRLGATSNDVGEAISVTSNGDVFVTGSFIGTIDVDPGSNDYLLAGSNGWSNMFLFRWNQNIGVGLRETKINEVKIYPNPASQQLTVNLTKPAAVEVYSITGKLMGSFSETTSQTIDVSEYAPGIYFLRTTYGSHKFIKE